MAVEVQFDNLVPPDPETAGKRARELCLKRMPLPVCEGYRRDFRGAMLADRQCERGSAILSARQNDNRLHSQYSAQLSAVSHTFTDESHGMRGLSSAKK